jgi:hypothetical protein
VRFLAANGFYVLIDNHLSFDNTAVTNTAQVWPISLFLAIAIWFDCFLEHSCLAVHGTPHKAICPYLFLYDFICLAPCIATLIGDEWVFVRGKVVESFIPAAGVTLTIDWPLIRPMSLMCLPTGL